VTSAIHDLGYKRYAGARRAASTRWRVIMRHQIASAWAPRWRYKPAVAIAVIVTVIAIAFIFIATDQNVVHLTRDRSLTFANGALPFSFAFYCQAAFLASLTVGAGIVAGDVASGAFVFYFVRSTRPIDYLLGKLAGYGLLVGCLFVIGPVLVAVMRIALSGATDLHAMVPQLVLVPKALAVGALATLGYTAIPLGISALVPNRRYALGLWAAYYLIAGSAASLLAITMKLPALGALDLATAVKSVAYQVLDLPLPSIVPLVPAVISIVLQSGLAIALMYWKLSTAQKAGVGGST
jgi:ABC-2 type transport system permease protein